VINNKRIDISKKTVNKCHIVRFNISVTKVPQSDPWYIKFLERMLVNFFFMARQPLVGHGLLIVSNLHYHAQAHHTREDSSARVIGPSKRPQPENTQHSQETIIHAPPAEFETAIPASERPQTHYLDRAATGIGMLLDYFRINYNTSSLIHPFVF